MFLLVFDTESKPLLLFSRMLSFKALKMRLQCGFSRVTLIKSECLCLRKPSFKVKTADLDFLFDNHSSVDPWVSHHQDFPQRWGARRLPRRSHSRWHYWEGFGSVFWQCSSSRTAGGQYSHICMIKSYIIVFNYGLKCKLKIMLS